MGTGSDLPEGNEGLTGPNTKSAIEVGLGKVNHRPSALAEGTRRNPIARVAPSRRIMILWSCPNDFWAYLVASSASCTADRELVPTGNRLIDYALSIQPSLLDGHRPGDL